MKYVIRAGGIGTRLWPFSRSDRPKQFHAMAGERTMLQDALERLAPIAAPEDVYVSTGKPMVELVREQLPQLPAENLIVEPALRNTGPAVGLECALLEARHPGCVVASLGSDHFIGRPDQFRRLLVAAEQAAEEHPEFLFTLGVKPTRVETGYGHICMGKKLWNVEGVGVHEVEEFTEKPDLERAKEYTASGRYLWNSNLFVWKAGTVLDLFSRFEPEMYETLVRIQRADGDATALVEEEYPKLKQIAIDNAIIERADHVATIEADIDWGDIGSWAALTDVIATDADGNLFSGDLLSIDSSNVTAYGFKGKLIALVGVDDLVVVDTPDAMLVCRKDQAQRVKEILERLNDDETLHRFT